MWIDGLMFICPPQKTGFALFLPQSRLSLTQKRSERNTVGKLNAYLLVKKRENNPERFKRDAAVFYPIMIFFKIIK